MTRARNFADVISGEFDIPAGSLTNAVPADGSITTAKLADDAVTDAKVADGVIKDSGRRNLILNGAMQVAQRGTSFTGVTATAYHLDRYQTTVSNDATLSVSQSTDTPDGFSSSLKVDVTTADTSIGSSQYAQIAHIVEAQNLQHLAYGTSSAKTITLSFYVKSSKTGTYCVTVSKDDATRYDYIGEYTISSANTWERKTITIQPDANIRASAGAIADDNGRGLFIKFILAAGSSRHGTADTWNSSYPADATSNQVNFLDSTSNDWYITGVQLEVGDSATDFEHRSYGEELSSCQRYFVGSLHFMCFGRGYSASSVGNSAPVLWPTTMRATPTITKSNEGDGGGSQTTMVFGSTRATGTNPEAESTNNTDTNYVTADITADAEL